MRRLFLLPSAELDHRTLERLFDLPPLPVSYDDPRSAYHTGALVGAGWRIDLTADETFWPHEGKPQFAGHPYVRRLHPLRRGAVTLTWLFNQPPVAGRCVSAEDVEAELSRAGWREQHFPPASDSGVITPAYARGRLLVTINALSGPPHACLWSFDLTRDRH